MVVISFYVPEDNAEAVKAAMFNAGAGRIGQYDRCSWQTKGVGQFRPLAGSNPFLGSPDKIEYVAELKIEMVCADDCVPKVLAALRSSHPYETPAFHVVRSTHI